MTSANPLLQLVRAMFCVLLAWASSAGVFAADRVELIGPEGFALWQEPRGTWQEAGDMAVEPSSPRKLTARSGRGVFYNGPEGRTVDLLTRQTFGDVELEVEFMVPDQSNSGIYFMGRYELQVFDSHGETSGTHAGSQCGGIYARWLDGVYVGGLAPRTNASLAPGQWQSFHVVFRAPRFDAQGRKIAHAKFETVRHNGVLIHENAVVTGPTRAARFEHAAEQPTGPLQLQGDHGPVAYRNLRIRPLPASEALPHLSAELHVMDTYLPAQTRALNGDWESYLRLIHEQGYAGVTWNVLPRTGMSRLMEAATERSLEVKAVYGAAQLTKEGLTWDKSLEDAMAVLSGRDSIVWVHIGSRAFASSDPAGDAVAVSGLRKLAAMAQAHGLRVAIYPHVGDWTERLQDAVRLAREVGHPALGVSFNLCHALMVGDENALPDLLAEAAPYLFIVTLNGADTHAAGTSWQRLIQTMDRGSYELEPLLQRLRELHWQGPIAIQGYGIGGDAAQNLQRSMSAWKTLIKQANNYF